MEISLISRFWGFMWLLLVWLGFLGKALGIGYVCFKYPCKLERCP